MTLNNYQRLNLSCLLWNSDQSEMSEIVSQLVGSYQEDRYIVPSLPQRPLAFFSNELKTPIAAKEYNYTITSSSPLHAAAAAVVYTSVTGLGSCLRPVGKSGGSTNHANSCWQKLSTEELANSFDGVFCGLWLNAQWQHTVILLNCFWQFYCITAAAMWQQ